MFESHLDGAGGKSRVDTQRGTIVTGAEVDQAAGQGIGRLPHGTVVSARDVAPDRIIGGSRGNLDGAPADPRARMTTQKSLPRGAENWSGSATLYRNGELPPTTPDGGGFRGSTTIVSSKQLDDVDAAHGTSHRGTPPAAQARQQDLEPGAYQLSDGNILLVNNQRQHQTITKAQFDYLVGQRQQAQQQQRQSLVGRVLGAVRR